MWKHQQVQTMSGVFQQLNTACLKRRINLATTKKAYLEERRVVLLNSDSSEGRLEARLT